MTKILTLIFAMAVPSVAIASCNNELELLAKNVYYEARGEGRKGMRLVADVTLNRVEDRRFPNSICSVIKQRGQFSWVGETKRDPRGESWTLALDVAKNAMRDGPKYTTDALYFRAGGGQTWQNRSRKLEFKNHSFY